MHSIAMIMIYQWFDIDSRNEKKWLGITYLSVYNIMINYKLPKFDAQGTHTEYNVIKYVLRLWTPFDDTKKPVCCSKK